MVIMREVESCPRSASTMGSEPTGLGTEALKVAQHIIDNPDSAETKLDSFRSKVAGLYPDEPSVKQQHDIVRRTRYAGLAAWYAIADLRVDAVLVGFERHPTPDLSVYTEGSELNFSQVESTQLTNFLKIMTGILGQAYAEVLDKTTVLGGRYASLTAYLADLEPEFATLSEQVRKDGWKPSPTFEILIPATAEGNSMTVLEPLLGAAIAGGKLHDWQEPECATSFPKFVARNMVPLTYLASITRPEFARIMKSSTRAGPRIFARTSSVDAYEGAVMADPVQPIALSSSPFTLTAGMLTERDGTIQIGPRNSPGFCAGFPYLHGPDGKVRSPVETSLVLGAIVANNTLLAEWPGVVEDAAPDPLAISSAA